MMVSAALRMRSCCSLRRRQLLWLLQSQKKKEMCPVVGHYLSTQPVFGVNLNPTDSLTYVDGQRNSPCSGNKRFTVVEPAKGSVLCECHCSNESEVDNAVQSAKQAFPSWSVLTGFERGTVLRKVASIIREHVEDIAVWEVRDNGKPIQEAKCDILGCADTFDYYAGVATTVMGDQIPLSGGSNFAYTKREPFGVCGGIGAWNYPFQTVSWKVAPALACGNTFVYKPSPLAPITAVILAEIVTAAGAPNGALNIVQGEGETGKLLCLHKDVSKVSFTGSVGTGQKIMQLCATNGLKPVTLELGGKGALLIFDDVNIENAVTGAMMANFYTQGEVCSNASKVFVHKRIMPEFTERLLERTKQLKIGNPHRPDTQVGAMITLEHMQKVESYIQSAKDEGARVLYGGERVTVRDGGCENGYFLSPCVISGVTDSMLVAREEIFGSVLLLMEFDSEEEAVHRANDTPYGLAAGLFTDNLQRAHRVADRLRSGTIWVNSYNVTPVEVPFGGQKWSGMGRENGLASLLNYTQLKSVYVDLQQHLPSPF